MIQEFINFLQAHEEYHKFIKHLMDYRVQGATKVLGEEKSKELIPKTPDEAFDLLSKIPPDRYVSSAFMFKLTSEGPEYWVDVNNRWREYLMSIS